MKCSAGCIEPRASLNYRTTNFQLFLAACDGLVSPSNDTDVDSVSYGPFEDEAGTCPEVDSKEAAFSILISELDGCGLQVQPEIGALQEARPFTASRKSKTCPLIRKCGM